MSSRGHHPEEPAMARIDLVALQQRLAQQQPTPVPAEPRRGATPAPPCAPRRAESTPSRRFGCGTGGHAARDDDHACGAALESDERTRGTRRGTGDGEGAAGADRRTEGRDGGGPRRGRAGVGGGTAAGGPAEQAGGGAVGRGRAGKEAGGGCRRPSRTGGGGQGRRARRGGRRCAPPSPN